MLTATYSINEKPIRPDELEKIQITKKDYIDYIESIKRNINNFNKEQK